MLGTHATPTPHSLGAYGVLASGHWEVAGVLCVLPSKNSRAPCAGSGCSGCSRAERPWCVSSSSLSASCGFDSSDLREPHGDLGTGLHRW